MRSGPMCIGVGLLVNGVSPAELGIREMVGYTFTAAPVDECFHRAARNGSVMSRVGVVDRLLVRRKYESLALGPDPPAAVSK